MATNWDDLVYMQDMTPDICETAPHNVQKTLIDKRDNNTYTIARIRNQINDIAFCWMTENIRIINKTITPSDSDVASNFTIPASNINGYNSDVDNTNAKAYYDSSKPTNGAYYTWTAATAGTGNSVTTTGNEASGSVCPKGWRLPTSGEFGEYYEFLGGLTSAYIVNSKVYKFLYSGAVDGGSVISNRGYYWSSTGNSTNRAYYLNITPTSISTYAAEYRHRGATVRCVAR